MHAHVNSFTVLNSNFKQHNQNFGNKVNLTIPRVWDKQCAAAHCPDHTQMQRHLLDSTLHALCQTLCEPLLVASTPVLYVVSLLILAVLQTTPAEYACRVLWIIKLNR